MEEKWEECDHEYQKDTDDATMNPIEDGREIVASSLACDKLASSVISTNGELRVKRSQKDHCTEQVSRRLHRASKITH